jgi:hypothetical protein
VQRNAAISATQSANCPRCLEMIAASPAGWAHRRALSFIGSAIAAEPALA